MSRCSHAFQMCLRMCSSLNTDCTFHCSSLHTCQTMKNLC